MQSVGMACRLVGWLLNARWFQLNFVERYTNGVLLRNTAYVLMVVCFALRYHCMQKDIGL